MLNEPCADNTDTYAWVSNGTHDKLYLIAGYNGLHEPGQAVLLPRGLALFPKNADLYAMNGRKPYASINFITAHDGFTLEDLVSYNEKHNEANGEDGRDGSDDNRSWNSGVEGPTDDPAIIAATTHRPCAER